MPSREARLIAVIRDPVDRAYSNWSHLWSHGYEPVGDFVEAVELEPERIADGWAPFWRYVDLGRYGRQLQHLYEHFPREQVLVLRYRELVDEPESTLTRIATFVGLDPDGLDGVPAENVQGWAAPSLANRTLRQVVQTGAWAGQVGATTGLAGGRASAPRPAAAGQRSPAHALARGAHDGAAALRGRHRTARRGDRAGLRRLARSGRQGRVLDEEVVSAVGPRRLVVEADPVR